MRPSAFLSFRGGAVTPARPGRFMHRDRPMKLRLPRSSVGVLFLLCAAASAQQLDGLWKLSIRDLDHREVAVLRVRFTDTPGTSCSGGEWKVVSVEASSSSDPRFFPIRDPLTYRVEESRLVIGRNGVCDAYLRLGGNFDGRVVDGSYDAFGKRGRRNLGEFSLDRADQRALAEPPRAR